MQWELILANLSTLVLCNDSTTNECNKTPTLSWIIQYSCQILFDLKLWHNVFETMIIYSFFISNYTIWQYCFCTYTLYFFTLAWPLPPNVAHSINSGCVWGLESVLEMKDLTYRPGHPNVQNPIAKPHWDPGSVFRLEGLKI